MSLADSGMAIGAVTRLLVDLNRSVGHRDLHSHFAAPLSAAALAWLTARWHAPFRAACVAEVRALARRGPVLHLSVHSFTPVLAGAGRMRYPVFLAANVVGAISWGAGLLVLGHLAASRPSLQHAALAVATAFVVGSTAVAVVRARRSSPGQPPALG